VLSSVSFIVCVFCVLCFVERFTLSVCLIVVMCVVCLLMRVIVCCLGCYCLLSCVLFVCCLIVVPPLPGENNFAVK
jgi:hypothetical protein